MIKNKKDKQEKDNQNNAAENPDLQEKNGAENADKQQDGCSDEEGKKEYTDEKIDEEMENETGEEQEDIVETLKQEVTCQKDKYLRLMAEFDNYKRRTSKEYERLVESAHERVLIDLIEVREHFQRAFAMSNNTHDMQSFYDGMKLLFTKFDDVLSRHGLSVFTEIGDEFDPELHDAMMKTPHPDIPEDHIAEIYEKGYKLKNRVIKHAKVIVSAGAAHDEENSKQSD